MATYTIAGADLGLYAKTAGAGVEDVITVNRPNANNVVTLGVLSDGASAMYVTNDGTAAVVAAVNTYELPAGVVSKISVVLPVGVTQLRLISAGTPKYSISREG